MRSAVLFALGCASLGWGQTPDVKIRTDLRLNYVSERLGDSKLRWYDSLGRHSLVSVEFGLEPGFRAFVSERLQKIPDNFDAEQLDEYYVEDPGLWRVGKQFLPFGRQRILRDAARGARGDSNLILQSLPIIIAIADNGPGNTRGVTGRIGGRLGISVAYGDHFAAQSTSLVGVRRFEDAKGPGRGYRLILGADVARRFGIVGIEVEAAALRRGHTALDGDTEISDVAITLTPHKYAVLTLGWGRDWRQRVNMLRAEGRLEIYRNVFVEPLVRLKDSELLDAGVSLRVTL